jgi:UDP-N-acetylmuramate: L-alanyl-gamma-D-glutamyl-meso-diaminopimelate ligase
MRIYILGICGTFMGGIAELARSLGNEVAGCDENVYPPMSTQLESLGISLHQGFCAEYLETYKPDLVVVGNVVSRGKHPAMEYVLNKGIPYVSGPQWLLENVLKDRWVLAVAGTHGKTTTSSLLAWILDQYLGNIGFLIGGVPQNFGISARLGTLPFFVIEADEYDSAFFDKRSKFLHYHPRTCVLNNVEFDHADIFDDLNAIKKQFHYLVRTVPGEGLIIGNGSDENVKDVLQTGVWTPVQLFNDTSGWHAEKIKADGSAFAVYDKNEKQGEVHWNLLGEHNIQNALAAIAAAKHVGVLPKDAIAAMSQFKNVKRRLEVKGCEKSVTVYDDFAHHPTAIAMTLAGLRAKVGKARIIAAVEMGSFTMRAGVHQDKVEEALKIDSDIFFIKTEAKSIDDLIKELLAVIKDGDHVVLMSNKGFGGIHQKLLAVL